MQSSATLCNHWISDKILQISDALKAYKWVFIFRVSVLFQHYLRYIYRYLKIHVLAFETCISQSLAIKSM